MRRGGDRAQGGGGGGEGERLEESCSDGKGFRKD